MRKFVIFFLLGFSVRVVASEVDDVKARLARENFPVPAALAEQIGAIEQELTPSATEKRSEIGPLNPADSQVCESRMVKIYYKLSDQSPTEFFFATYVRPRAEVLKMLHISRVSGVVIQPTLAGPTGLEKAIAFGLCTYGFASLTPNETILGLSDNLPDFVSYDKNMRIEMVRARRLVDVLSEQSDVAANKIGVIGFSRGAIAGALLIGIEPRIRFAFLGAGGVGLAHVISHSQTELGKADIAKQLKASGLTLPQFEAKLRDTLRYDGILFSHRFDPAHLKLMLVYDDQLVDVNNQELLSRSFGNPVANYRNNGHVGSIVDAVFKEWGLQYLPFFWAQAHTIH